MSKTLREFIATLSPDAIVNTMGNLDVLVTAPIVEASNDIEVGGVFVARKGLSVDGHQFIPQAIEGGAVAIVGEHELDNLSVPYIQVQNAQAITGHLASAFYDFPSHKLIVIGVTGTDGKTTTSHIIHSILRQVGDSIRPGLISTIEAEFGGTTEATGLHVTTPSAPSLQRYLARMVENKLTHVVLEMTSHGLAQGRLNGVAIDVAVLTNVMHEHLDYHGTWEAYRDAKAIMFQMLSKTYKKSNIPKIAVINGADESYDYFAQIPADKTISYGINEADLQAMNIRYQPDGTFFSVDDTDYQLNLVGEFNVSNALAGIGAGRALNVSDEAIQHGLSAVTSLSGRMQRIDEGQDFTAIVDFAHTPNALKRALEAGRTMLPHAKKLIAVFGSAGLRDVEKRRLMAEVSVQMADITILTAEDPRTESLDDILQMMATACEYRGGIEGETFFRVPDRGEALYRACDMAQAGDIVMACGKGHEQSMCFGTIEYPWDDREALQNALRGTPLKTLPTATG